MKLEKEQVYINSFSIQLYACIVLSLSCFLTGFSMTGWPTYVDTLLHSEDSPIRPSFKLPYTYVIKLAATFIPIFFSVFLNEECGRKGMKILCGLFFVLSWSVLSLAETEMVNLLGQILSRVVIGLDLVTTYAYISEIPDDYRRGSFLCLPLLQLCMGAFVSLLTATYFSYYMITYMNLFLSMLQLMLIGKLKDTPAFLLRNGKDEEAVDSLRFYRGEDTVTDQILLEMSNIRLDLLREENFFHEDHTNALNWNYFVKHINGHLGAWKMFESSETIRRAAYAVTLQVNLISLMGAFAIKSYVANYFADVFPEISYDMCVMVLYGSMVIGSGISVILIDLMPRRNLMIASSVFCTMALMLLASLFRFRWADAWVVPLLIVAFCCVYQMGVSSVAAVQIAEMFPSSVKVIVIMVSTSCVGVAHVLTLYICREFIDDIGLEYGFIFFAVMALLNTIWAHYFMMETRNVPVRDIMRMYASGYLYKDEHRALLLR